MKNLKNTIIGDITVLTLNKFLCKLMLQSARDDRDTAEMLISRMYDWPNIPIDGPQLIKRSVELDSNPDKELACKNTIKRQMEFVSAFSFDKIELIDELITDAALVGSDPKYLVRLSRRKWFVADPNDFRLINNNVGIACFYLRPGKVRVYSFDKWGSKLSILPH